MAKGMKDLFIQIQIAKDYHEEESIRRRTENNLIAEGKLKTHEKIEINETRNNRKNKRDVG